MNDRYLYRAKRTDNGEWVEGFYFCMEHTDCRHTHHFIMPLGTDLSLGTPIEKIQVEVDPSTICQCTGLKDKNGKLIWENDIVKINGVVYICFWNKSNFEWGFKNNAEDFGVAYISSDDIRIVGNIFDNPELLEVGE